MIGIALALGVAASAIDARERIIPDALCASIAACGLIFQLLRTLLRLPAWMFVSAAVACAIEAPTACIAASVCVLVSGLAFELAWRHLRGASGLGMGDIKYLAVWTLLLGWRVLVVLGIACLMGAVRALAQSERDFALGPWITLSCGLVVAYLALAAVGAA